MRKDFEEELHNNIENYTFEDLFDIDDVQKLADAISQTFEVGVVFTSPEGKPITKPSNFCNFCMNVVRKTEKGQQNCFHSDEVLGSNHEGTIIAPCLSAGLLDAGTSIRVGGKHIASCLVGQVMIEGLLDDEELNRKRALDIGADPDEYIEELKKVPVKTRKRFEQMVDLVGLVVQQLSDLGYKNFVQKEEIRYRKKLEEEIQKERDMLQYLNTHDKLTGLHSRDYFEEMMTYYENHKECYPIAIVSADANNLKLMNDVFGHHHGDLLLKIIARLLVEKIPTEAGVVARYGGDEIQVILPNTDYETASNYCAEVKAACLECDECVLKPSVSLGVHVAQSPKEKLSSCLRMADEAMYADKDRIKKNQNIINDILTILYREKVISRVVIGRASALVSEFGAYLELEFRRINDIIHAIQIQDLGMIAFLAEEKSRKERGHLKATEEIRTMRQHVEISHRIAKMFENTLPVASIVLQTHECWNGTGYPNQIKGDDISMEARIIYLVYEYVLMVTPKPEGRGYARQDAIDRIIREKSTRFDPVIVDEFIRFINLKE